MARRTKSFAGSAPVSFRDLAEHFGTREDGSDVSRREAAAKFPVRWTRYYLDLADPTDPEDPIRRIAFPEGAELEPHPFDLADPVGEQGRTPVPYVVRKHRDRAILLVTSRCHVYCRFCFRRSFPDGDHRDPSPQVLDDALRYLADERELREVILSGGDPLVLHDDELRGLIGRLSALPQLTHLRVHTRAPVHDPARITPGLVAALASGLPMWVVTHFDHPREITEQTQRVVTLMLQAGMPVLNQTVLLAGVNDDPGTLESLFRALVARRIKPYYLHHPDRVPGAGTFHVTVERGRQIYTELRRRLGGGATLPEYVIDMPDGSGKVPV